MEEEKNGIAFFNFCYIVLDLCDSFTVHVFLAADKKIQTLYTNLVHFPLLENNSEELFTHHLTRHLMTTK